MCDSNELVQAVFMTSKVNNRTGKIGNNKNQYFLRNIYVEAEAVLFKFYA